MVTEERSFGLVRAVLCLAVALIAAPVVRGLTTELTHELGGVWPFSLVHCRVTETPGCTPEAARHAALHVR